LKPCFSKWSSANLPSKIIFILASLQDNFIHADLHPGNILVREDPAHGWWGQLAQRLALFPREHMVLLDVGMIARLTDEDQRNLVQVRQSC
jgi:aarF domain-containing kinase